MLRALTADQKYCVLLPSIYACDIASPIYHEATALTQCVLKIVTKWQKNQTKSVLVHTHLILTPTMLTVITKESTRTRTRVTSNARAAIPTGWKTSRCKRRKQKQLINTMARLTFV